MRDLVVILAILFASVGAFAATTQPTAPANSVATASIADSAVTLTGGAGQKVTGILPTANGGTGANLTGTQYGLPYFSTTTTMGTTAAGTATTLLHGNAAGIPAFSSVAVADLAANTLQGSRNLAFNGNFGINQRAGTYTADNAYTMDRWRMLLASAGCATASQSTTSPPARSKTFGLLTVTATNNKKFGFFQPFEGVDVYALRGLNVTLSAQMKVNSVAAGHIQDVRMAILEWTGTEDAISATPISNWGTDSAGINAYTAGWAQKNTPANLSVTASWAQYSVTTSTVIGATATNLGLFVWNDDMGTTAADTLSVGEVQLEIGSTATAFHWRGYGMELARCQRYCWTMPIQVSSWQFGIKNQTTFIDAIFRPPVTMRAIPTITHNISAWDATGSPAATAIACYDLTGAAWITITGALSVTFGYATVDLIQFRCTAATSFSGTNGIWGSLKTGSGVIVIANAEL